ncbi:Abi family protein [Ulvibacterium sp.]|uniref:Abi family protein n=1 Tax=Ulvibacterium sp. TaxID=2665914 RepID=UPI003CC6C951
MDIYKKPPTTHKKQLHLLISRGLEVKDFDKALHLIDKIGYFRLTGYLYPQLEIPKENHKFKPNSYLESSFKMYCFDRELRILLLGNIEKIEVALRSKLTYYLSLRYDPYWYKHDKLFKDISIQNNGKSSIEKSKLDSSEDFVIQFKRKYVNNDMPSWMVMEIITFAHLSKTFSNLKDTSIKSKISNDFGVPYQILENWLMALTYCRNICAHHSRFWNRQLAIKVLKTKNPLPYKWIEQSGICRNKSYFYLSIIQYLVDRINPNNKFKEKIIKLFEKYPNIDYTKSMDFPIDWQQQPLWKIEEIKLLG